MRVDGLLRIRFFILKRDKKELEACSGETRGVERE